MYTTGPIFNEFVEQLVHKLDNHGSGPYYFVMDNAKIHYNPALYK
jgi:hypothetical protein